MKTLNISLFCLLLITGSSARAATSESGIEQRITSRNGKRVEWIRDEKTEHEIRDAVTGLLRRPLTADRAAQVALLNNRNLQATLEEIGVSQAELREAGLLKNPVFEGSELFPNNPPTAATLVGSLSQDFLDLLMLPLRKHVAAARLEQTRLRVADAVLQLVADTKVAFYELQAQQQLLASLKTVLEANQAALDLTLHQHQAGNVPDLTLANQQIAYSASRLEAANAESEIREKRERLNRLMGLWGADIDWSAAPQLPEVPAKDLPMDNLERLAIQQRFDVAAAEAEVSSVAQALGLTQTYRLLGMLEFGVQSERNPAEGQIITGPTVKIELPVFNQGQARVAKLQAQFRQSERRLEALAIDVRSEVREQRDRLVAKRDAARFYKDELWPEQTRVVELTQLEYNAMLVGVFDLLATKKSELGAERGYIESARDYWVTRAQLEHVVGGRLQARDKPSPKTAADSAQSTAEGPGTHKH